MLQLHYLQFLLSFINILHISIDIITISHIKLIIQYIIIELHYSEQILNILITRIIYLSNTLSHNEIRMLLRLFISTNTYDDTMCKLLIHRLTVVQNNNNELIN